MSSLAKARARKLLEDYCINSPAELDLYKLSYGEKLFIQEKTLETHIGRISYRDGCGIITISNSINEDTQKRFVIAHEFGHYFNERMKNGFNGCIGSDMLGLKTKNQAESEANAFASELLMPETWFKDFTKRKKFSYELLKSTANYFGVSLSAAALKYSEIGPSPTAIIMSVNGKVKWSRINKYFPFQWIPIGYEVNNNSYAYDIFENYKQHPNLPQEQTTANSLHSVNVRRQTSDIKKLSPINDSMAINDDFTRPNEVLADAWFWNDNNYKKNYVMMEYNIPMPRYNAVLTVLWEK